MTSGDIVWIVTFDEMARHLFAVHEVLEDHVTGVALTGPLAGCYGEPDLTQIAPLGTPVSR